MTWQIFDNAGNVEAFHVTISISVVNDNRMLLFLNGPSGRNYMTSFNEPQEYLGGPVPSRLSNNLTITDEDSGAQYLEFATILIQGASIVILKREAFIHRLCTRTVIFIANTTDLVIIHCFFSHDRFWRSQHAV